MTEEPNGITQAHLDFLDMLRDSSVTNMFGAAPYLAEEFGIDVRIAREYLQFWMRTFGQENRLQSKTDDQAGEQ